MARVNSAHKSGFRTEESTGFLYRGYFFRRFVQRYPQAIRELATLLPLFQEIFGDPVDPADHAAVNACLMFDRNLLLSKEELLIFVEQSQLLHPDGLFLADYHVPDDFSLPNDHPSKCNEAWVKNILGSCIVWSIAKMRADAGDDILQRHLAEREDVAQKAVLANKERAKQIARKKRLRLSEGELNAVVTQETYKLLKSVGYFDDPVTSELLQKYWRFYEAYHGWLERYCLQKDWLRRSFFIALRRDLLVLWPDIGFDVSLSSELVTELHGEPGRVDFRPNEVPLPPVFNFTLTTLTSMAPGFVNSQHKWEAMPYWIFGTRDAYLEGSIADFQRYIDRQAFSDQDETIKDALESLLAARTPARSADELENEIDHILQHIFKFASLEAGRAARTRIIEDFRKHLAEYVDSLLPALERHLKSNAGRPPSLARIEWILCWNVDGLTDKEICDKFSRDSGFSYDEMAEELRFPGTNPREFLSSLGIKQASTFYSAKKAMRKYDIPIRSGRPGMPIWRLKRYF